MNSDQWGGFTDDCSLSHCLLILADSADEPVAVLFDDFVGAVGEVEGLGFAVVAHVEHAGAVDEGLVAVCPRFGAGHSVHGDFDEGEGVEFDEGVIFPVGAGVGDESGLVFGRQGGDVAFDGGSRAATCRRSAGGKKNAQGEHENGEFRMHRFLHELITSLRAALLFFAAKQSQSVFTRLLRALPSELRDTKADYSMEEFIVM